MASSDKDASCANDPDFAVICAFLQKFSDKLQLDYPDFKQLQDWITNTDEVPNGLRNLHVKLMRKTRRTVHECAWETALSKFCFSYSSQDGWEIERFGYKKSSLKVKLRILRELLESQFDRNNKFRAKLLTMSADSLRSQPIGRDRLGHSYWLTQDLECNLRVYQEHLDEEIWQVVATNREELVKLISRLKGNEVVLPSEIGVVDEDSSSNSCSAAIIKPPPPEEKDDSQESNQSTEGRIPNIKIKLGGKDSGIVLSSEAVVSCSEEKSKEKPIEKSEEKKVKPLVISHSKITMEKSKKRLLEEPESAEHEEVKKQRPSLLDSKREKKLCKYEKAKDDDEEGDEDDGEESEDDGEEEEEEDESAGDDEEDDEDGEEDDKGERNAVAEEHPEEKDGEDKKDPIVGEAVEDPIVLTQGEGSGQECESFCSYAVPFGIEPQFSEVIEEVTFFVFGEGSGVECLVGNSNANETEPKATFFFGQPGCLKLSPVKNQQKTDESEACNDDAKEEGANAALKPANGENHQDVRDDNSEETVVKSNADVDEEKSKNGKKEEKMSTRSSISTRKRRLSGEKLDKQAKKLSESETDLNSENLEEKPAEIDEEEDIGGKRLKIRSKLLNADIRRKVEAQRKNATVEGTTSSSGEDELPRKKVLPKKVEKNVEKILPLKAKLKQAALADKARNEKLANETVPSDEKEDVTTSPQKSPPMCIEPPSEDMNKKRTAITAKLTSKQTKKSHPAEVEEGGHEIPKKKQSPAPTPTLDLHQNDVNLKNQNQESEQESPKIQQTNSAIEEQTTYENQRKRRSSDEKKESSLPKTLEQPPVVAKTRSSRRSGPPEPVMELPQLKRTRVKTSNVTPSERSELKKEVPQSADKNEKTKVKSARVTQNKSEIELGVEEQKNEIVKQEIDSASLKSLKELVAKEETEVDETKNSVNTTPKSGLNTCSRQQAAQKQPATIQRRKNHDDVDTKNIIDLESDTTPVRMSRRIAQLKIREEAERRKMEEVALRNMKAELKKKKKAEKVDDPTVSEPSEHSSDHADSEVEIKKKSEKKKKCPGKGGWSSGSEEPEEEEEEQYETDPGSPLFRSDHEFSPESELEDESQVVPLKRARTARKEGEEIVTQAVADESCQKCGKSDHPEWILLCDKCDKGYHCSCLSPVIFYIPEGDWYCPPCQQEELIIALENHLKDFDDLVQRKKEEEEEKLRLETQERLDLEKAEQDKIDKKNKRKQVRKKRGEEAQKNRTHNRKPTSYDDESEENGTDSDASKSSQSNSSGSGSSKSRSDSASDSDDEPIYKLRKRRQINVSYRLNEYDDMIKSALKEEEDEVAGAGNLGRGKDISTIIEADKEEKLRQQQQRVAEENGELDKPSTDAPAAEDSGSEFEPLKRKPKGGRFLKKKSRKLTTLDISSEGDNDSDEDFKTSSMEDEEEDDEDEEDATQSSDSSLEVYRRGHRVGRKNKKKTRRAARRAARERRKDRNFIVEDSDASDSQARPRSKKKRKKDSDYTESETNDDEEELSENIDSDDLCDDSTDSEVSDGAWHPSKRKKQRSNTIARKSPKLKPTAAPKAKKTKRVDEYVKSGKSNDLSEHDDSDDDDDNDSVDSSRKTRGKRCLYLEDYEDDSSDGGIKPGVKRPDTPPEEREKFIKKQEEIKRMLAEKNAEGAKLAATPRLIPIKTGPQRSPAKLDSLSTVPLSVIRQAKVLDIDYLQRKGESVSEEDLDESEFDDDDLPDDFNPEDMDEEAIARMVEEEDFAQQQLKLPPAPEVLRKKSTKETESILKPTAPTLMPQPLQSTPSLTSGLQEPVRKKLPRPTMHPPLLRHNYGPPLQHMLQHNRAPAPQHLTLLQNALSAPLNHPLSRSFAPTTQAIPATTQSMSAHPQGISAGGDPNKPRGRRKKITPLRDPLQKQQAAAAASAAAAAASKPRADSLPPPQLGKTNVKPPSVTLSGTVATPGVIKSTLSIAQPPRLYKPPPANTQPSVITRMSHLQGRPLVPVGGPPFPEQGNRFYRPQQQPQSPSPQTQPPPNAMISGNRPPMRHRGPPMSSMNTHHSLRPSYVSGPPPLRPSGPPISLPNDIREHGPPRQSSVYSGADQQYTPRHSAPSHLNPYRPQMFGSPGFPQRGPPTNSSQPSIMRPSGAPPEYTSPGSYVGGYGYYPPPLSVPHSAPTRQTASVPSSVIVSASSLAVVSSASALPAVAPPQPPPPVAAVTSRLPTTSSSLIEKNGAPVAGPVPTTSTAPSILELSRKKLTTLETFNTSKTATPPPLQESSESQSPYSSNPPTIGGVDDTPDDARDESPIASTQSSTSEFSGLVSYFSSQHDDLNT